MKTNKAFTLSICVLILCLFVSGQTFAKIKLEFGTSTISSDNVYKDNRSYYDAYSTSVATVKAYPFSSLEVSVSGEQNTYREASGLSNLSGSFNLTFIPTKQASKFQLFFSGSIIGRTYHSDFQMIDNNYGEVNSFIGYQLRDNFFIKGGFSYRSTAYVNSDDDHKLDMDFFLGANFAFLKNNTLDIETGLSLTNYSFKDAHLTGSARIPIGDHPILPYDEWWLKLIPDSRENLRIFFLSPRLSRPLGMRSGINLTYQYREFLNYNDGLLWGGETSFLSPWTTVWDGQSVTLNLKSYLIPNLILKTGLGYRDKTYPITSARYEEDETRKYGEAIREDFARRDFETTGYLSINWPISFNSGLKIEPTLSVEYTENKSNKEIYKYDDMAITAGVSMKF